MESVDVASSELDNDQKETFYIKAQDYWKNIPATVNGVLGGFGHISEADIRGSSNFLKQLFETGVGQLRALDCGAGIGRITKNLLVKYFNKIDLVDQNESFISKAKEYIGDNDKIGDLYVNGLQNFVPEHKYDIIWCQWVLGHLTDTDLTKFMQNCSHALNENGCIVVKENISKAEVELDEVDSSVTRPYELLICLLKQAGLTIVSEVLQTGFPKGLYRVKMIALSPNKLEELS